MEQEGYKVRWTAERKNITYTCPNGKKCCDDKLHESKYLKENMDYEFGIRTKIVCGLQEGSNTTEQNRSAGYTYSLTDREQLEGAIIALNQTMIDWMSLISEQQESLARKDEITGHLQRQINQMKQENEKIISSIKTTEREIQENTKSTERQVGNLKETSSSFLQSARTEMKAFTKKLFVISTAANLTVSLLVLILRLIFKI